MTASSAMLRRHVHELTMRGPRSFRSSAQVIAGEYIVDVLRKNGWTVRRRVFSNRPFVSLNDDSRQPHPFPLRFFRRIDGVNLVATPPGAAADATGWTALSAHYDTVTNSGGADDNTSGVAALLEAARLLADTDKAIALVFFDREETGMQGADAWARAEGPSIASVTNLEMVGHFIDTPNSNPIPLLAQLTFPRAARELRSRQYRRNTLIIVHDRRSRAIAASLAGACGSIGLPSVGVADPRPPGRARHLFTAIWPATWLLELSDHVKFWNRRIPAVMAMVGTPNATPHYHQLSDTLSTLDYSRLAQVADAVVAHALHMSSAS